ncbi:MAG: TonB-dependent receptor [Bacteroidetes bacterium]|nr:TonB-dependent receptor [Bacteroidota bacterium]
MKSIPRDHSKYILFLFAFLLNISLNAQTVFSGFVKDIQSGAPLIGTNISIKGEKGGTVTDINGNFELSTSEALPLTLVISYLGYSTKEKLIVADSKNLNIYLEGDGFTTQEVVVTASRWKEKIYETANAVSIIPTAKIEAYVVTNPLTLLQNTPGVQIVTQGTERVNVGLRDGAALFGTFTQVLLDNRSLASVGLNYFDGSNSALSSLDLERVEVVRGPATAIYGPGISQGIVHFLSKDPFKYPGTSIEVVGGERATFRTSIRHASHSIDKKFGYKINASFRRSNDWGLDSSDSTDFLTMAAIQDEIIDPRTGEVVYRTGGELRKDNVGFGANATIEYRPDHDIAFTAGGGFSRYEGLLRQSQGEMLIQSNEYYGVVKAKYERLFAQVTFNTSGGFNNENPTFLYRSGQISPLKRTHLEAQLQYSFDLRPLYTKLVVGGEYQLFRANSQELSFGRYDATNNYDLTGAYAQTKTALLDQIDLILAARVDYFKPLDEITFSPRVALLYKLNERNAFRATFNKALIPPNMFTMYVDLPLANFGAFDLWALGGREAQTFSQNPNTTSFIPGVGETQGIGMPLQTGYAVVLGALAQNLPPELIAYLQSEIPNIDGFSNGVPIDVNGNYLPLNNTEPLSLANYSSYEIGYSGRISDKISGLIEFYVDKRSNTAAGPFQVSPLVVIPTLPEDLAGVVASTLNPSVLANFGLTPEIVAGIFQEVAIAVARPDGVPTPLGLVETEQMPEGGLPHLAYGYGSPVGELIRLGFDAGIEYIINNNFSVNGTYSHEFKNIRRVEEIEDEDLFPTFPKNKFRLGLNFWQLPNSGFRANINLQYDAKWRTSEGIYSGEIPERAILDAGIGYKWFNWLSMDVSATNVLNHKYRSRPGLPKIGRQILVRAVYSFGN